MELGKKTHKTRNGRTALSIMHFYRVMIQSQYLIDCHRSRLNRAYLVCGRSRDPGDSWTLILYRIFVVETIDDAHRRSSYSTYK